MPHIHVLTTGGTIDKVYSTSGELEVGPPALPSVVAPVLTDLTYDVTPVLQIDSLDMTDEHRAQVCAAVEAVTGDLVLITHGTDTMPETARYLEAHLSPAAAEKVIVLTGAMQPAAMRASDAAYNIGGATVALQLLSPGVHVVMSGRVLPAAAVAKDTTRGVFVERAAPSPDLERLLRWERQGGSWEVLGGADGSAAGQVTVALLRCDGGEEVERLTSAEADVRRHVATRR